jgi:hypothetical protein
LTAGLILLPEQPSYFESEIFVGSISITRADLGIEALTRALFGNIIASFPAP